MKKVQVRELLEKCWSLEDHNQGEYFKANLLPYIIEDIRTLSPRFLRQLVRVIEDESRKPAS